MADAGESKKTAHSSREYSGIAEEATIGVSGNARDLNATLSSGSLIQKDRESRKRKCRQSARGKMMFQRFVHRPVWRSSIKV